MRDQHQQPIELMENVATHTVQCVRRLAPTNAYKSLLATQSGRLAVNKVSIFVLEGHFHFWIWKGARWSHLNQLRERERTLLVFCLFLWAIFTRSLPIVYYVALIKWPIQLTREHSFGLEQCTYFRCWCRFVNSKYLLLCAWLPAEGHVHTGKIDSLSFCIWVCWSIGMIMLCSHLTDRSNKHGQQAATKKKHKIIRNMMLLRGTKKNNLLHLELILHNSIWIPPSWSSGLK